VESRIRTCGDDAGGTAPSTLIDPRRNLCRMVDNNDGDDDVDPDDPDTAYSPASERETESRQEQPRTSPATQDQEIDDDTVKVLPGTGGPDDPGDVDVDDEDFNFPAG
jgi:hypothetical protein